MGAVKEPGMPDVASAKTYASWRYLAVLTLVYACHHLDRTILFSLVEPVRAEFDLSDGQIGALTGLAYGISFGLAALPIGLLIDRVDRRRLLAGATILWSGLTALTGFAQSFIWLIAARIGVGGSEAAGAPASLSLISDLFPPKRRSIAIGILYSSLAIGGISAALITKFIAEEFGWRAAFFVAGVPGILLGLIVLFKLKEPVRGAFDGPRAKTGAGPVGVGATLKFLLTQGAFVNVLIGMMLAVSATASIGVWLTAFLIRYHDMSLGQAAVLLGLAYGVFAAFGSIGGGLIGDWVGKDQPHRRILACMIGILLIVPLAGTALLTGATPVAAVLFVICPTIIQALLAPGFATGLNLAPASMRGTASAMLQLAINLVGAGLAPTVVGLVSERYGLQHALVVIVCLCAAWSAVHFTLAAMGYNKAAARVADPASFVDPVP